jgi:hypothetical protein
MYCSAARPGGGGGCLAIQSVDVLCKPCTATGATSDGCPLSSHLSTVLCKPCTSTRTGDVMGDLLSSQLMYFTYECSSAAEPGRRDGRPHAQSADVLSRTLYSMCSNQLMFSVNPALTKDRGRDEPRSVTGPCGGGDGWPYTAS